MGRTVTIDDGDVLLFSRRCLSMPYIPAFICAGAKVAAWTPYDHIGVVTRSRATGQLQLLEANMGGVTAYALQERLTRSKALAFAVRKLVATGDREPDMSTARFGIQRRAAELVGRPYNPSFLDMTWALLASMTHHRTPEAAVYDQLHRAVRDPATPPAVLTACQRQASQVNTTKAGELAAGTHPARYYCSHVVADVLRSANVLAPARHPKVGGCSAWKSPSGPCIARIQAPQLTVNRFCQVRWPAWKCVACVEGPSHPDTPTRGLSQAHIPADFSSNTLLRTMHTVPGYAYLPPI